LLYDPRAIDAARIELSADILDLRELLARHNHDVWATQRLKEGWHYGPQRDDTRKEHPCLIPYENLPESEKEYDRRAAMEILKVIVALGYRIVKC
jgi:hypothetical protein